jgi:hypothetical protein
MTSKIKVDNIENQCGGAVVTKCGGTTTISGTVVKSNTLQASDAGNIISQSGTTITLGASGDTINLASGASQSGFGRTGTVDWDTTPKTGTFSAVSGNGYFCNTSGGAFTVNLPAGSAGAIVSLADYAATWQTNNVTITPNGTDKIGSLNQNATLDVKGQSVTLVFVDSTQGWINTMDSTSNVRGAPPFIVATGGTITTCGDCKIHTFTGPGSFAVCAAGSCGATRNLVSHMIIAGGAGGGGAANNFSGAGGGGAGGYREVKNPLTPYTASPLDGYPTPANRITVSSQTYPITVGGGGSGGPCGNNRGVSGSDSIFSTITSTGGGGGGTKNANDPTKSALAGGSGGGGTADTPTAGGAGNTPPTSPSQGNPGGPSNSSDQGGGGGGAGATGGAGNVPTTGSGGLGGDGVTTSINASPVARAGGGGGGNYAPGPNGTGGSGGGGNGGRNTPGTSGTDNTGSGGGGSGSQGGGCESGGNGGSGIVIIRYKFQ